jgi:prevent-host-death family protein
MLLWMTKEVSVSKFKAICLELLREVQETGESILITKHGKPVAEVHPPRAKRLRSPVGVMKGRGEILGDIVSPAAPAEIWDALKK